MAWLDILTCAPAARDAGVVLLALAKGPDKGALVALDQSGQTVWQHEFPFVISSCRLSLQRTILVMTADGRALDIGLNGQLLRQWHGADFPTESGFGAMIATGRLHHSIEEIAPDIYLSLSRLDGTDGRETVLVFDRHGSIHWEWILDEKLSAPASASCAIMDPTDGGIILSMGPQNAIAKLSRRGVLDWVLGGAADWCSDKRLTQIGGPFRVPRDLSFAANGDLLFYANGTAQSYRLDAVNMRAEQSWQQHPPPVAGAFGTVVETPRGNRFLANADGGNLQEFSLEGHVVLQASLPREAGWSCVDAAYMPADPARWLC